MLGFKGKRISLLLFRQSGKSFVVIHDKKVKKMMEHDLQETMALLGRTPAALDALVRGLPETWTKRNEGESTWSVFDVVGH